MTTQQRDQRQRMPVGGFRRIAYLVLAAAFFAIGFVGVFVPGLPTTPFLLLMSYFLIRASPKLHAAALSIPFVGGAIRNWEEHRSVSKGVKWTAFLMIAIMVGLSLMTTKTHVAMKMLIVSLGIVGCLVVWRLPTAD